MEDRCTFHDIMDLYFFINESLEAGSASVSLTWEHPMNSVSESIFMVPDEHCTAFSSELCRILD